MSRCCNIARSEGKKRCPECWKWLIRKTQKVWTPEERYAAFDKRYEVQDNGCWLWTGNLNREGGYGRVRGFDGKMVMAHRFSYERYFGPIPEGLSIDHRCATPRCVNPWHLEPVTHAENVRRGKSCHRIDRRHCKRGHLLAGDNIYRRGKGKIECRKCIALLNRLRAQA